MMEWISVEDRLPRGRCLVVTPHHFFGVFTNEVEVGYYDNPDEYENPSNGKGWLLWSDDREITVTHWMHLPNPPKE